MGAPRGVDMAAQRRLRLHDRHAVGHGAAAEARQHAAAEARGDQRQLRLVFAGGVRDLRLVALLAQRVHQEVVADRSGRPRDPFFAAEIAQLDRLRLREPVARR